MKKSLSKKNFEAALVLVIIIAAYFNNLQLVQFHGDESCWVGISNHFESFLKGKFDDQIWKTDWPNLYTQSITYYVIGAARQLGGWKSNELNGIYNFSQSYEENLQAGNIPNDSLLWWSRAGVTSMAVLGVWLLFILLRKHGNPFVTYGWVAIAITNEYLLLHLRRAMNEGILFGMVMLVIFCLYQVLAVWKDKTRSGNIKLIVWCALAGMFTGLAGQTKLNGVTLGFGILLALFLVAIREFQTVKHEIPRLFGGALIAGVFAIAFFIAPNPVFYQDPVGATIRVLEARAVTMTEQAKATQDRTFMTLSEKYNIGPLVLNKYTPLAQTRLNFLFFGVGAGLLFLRTKGWLKKQNDQHVLIAILTIGLTGSLPAFLSMMDWDRYFLLPVIFSTVIILFGIDFLVRVTYEKMKVWVADQGKA